VDNWSFDIILKIIIFFITFFGGVCDSKTRHRGQEGDLDDDGARGDHGWAHADQDRVRDEPDDSS
jgi:hypothetical protein